jgi:hypothetical protein
MGSINPPVSLLIPNSAVGLGQPVQEKRHHRRFRWPMPIGAGRTQAMQLEPRQRRHEQQATRADMTKLTVPGARPPHVARVQSPVVAARRDHGLDQRAAERAVSARIVRHAGSRVRFGGRTASPRGDHCPHPVHGRELSTHVAVSPGLIAAQYPPSRWAYWRTGGEPQQPGKCPENGESCRRAHLLRF